MCLLYLQIALLYTLMSVRLTLFSVVTEECVVHNFISHFRTPNIYVEQVVSKVFMAQAFLTSSAIPNSPSVQKGHLRYHLPGDCGHS